MSKPFQPLSFGWAEDGGGSFTVQMTLPNPDVCYRVALVDAQGVMMMDLGLVSGRSLFGIAFEVVKSEEGEE